MVSLFIVLSVIMSGYESGGYVYERPSREDNPERVLTDDQARLEIRAFSEQLEPLVWPWAADKWKPYFENEHLGQESRTALDGLRTAIDHLSADMYTALPVAILKKGHNGGYKAIVGDLSTERRLESWQRRDDRGVTKQSVVLFVAKNRHHVIFGDQAGLRDIDTNTRPAEQELPIDWFDYLPHIDGSTDYTVRHGGLSKIAVGDAVFPTLREHSLQQAWEHYLTSSHS